MSTFHFARGFARTAHFTRSCSTDRKPTGFAVDYCASWTGTSEMDKLRRPPFILAVELNRLTISQLKLLIRGFRERLDLSQLVEWTVESNIPGVFQREKRKRCVNLG